MQKILTLTTGAALAQAIPALVSPLLARIYTPQDFGLFALYFSIVNLALPIATGSYEQAVMLPAHDEKAMNIIALIGLIAFFFSTAIFLLIASFHYQLLTIGTIIPDDDSGIFLLVPLSIFLLALFQALMNWANRKEKYKFLSSALILQSLVTAIAMFILGKKNFPVNGLILGTLLGQGVVFFILSCHAVIAAQKNALSINWPLIRSQARRYQNFPRYTLIQGLLDVFKESCLVFLVLFFFGPVILGLYAFASKILSIPLTIIVGSVSRVFHQKAAAAYNRRVQVWPLAKKMIVRLALMGAVMFIVILVTGPRLFGVIFGNNWREAGIIAQIISFWFLARFIFLPLAIIPQILKKQKDFLFIGLGYNMAILSAFIFFALRYKSIFAAFLAVSLVGGFYLIASILWIRKILKNTKYAN